MDKFKNIYILAAPPGIEDIEFDEYVYKDFYMDKCFKEFKVGITPDQKILIKINAQERYKQYGFQHSVTRTIHFSQGKTSISMETEVSLGSKIFFLWDKGQILDKIIIIKEAKDTIFVGD